MDERMDVRIVSCSLAEAELQGSYACPRVTCEHLVQSTARALEDASAHTVTSRFCILEVTL